MAYVKLPYFLSAESAKAILDAANPAVALSPAAAEGVRRWLQARVKAAMDRANAKPIVKADVTKVKNAYRRFEGAIRGLRNHDDPPPQIPVVDGMSAWDEWIDGFRVIPFERGRQENRDWQLIAALLALYEVTSDKKAAATFNGPTMRFLKAAFDELALTVPDKSPSYFISPNPDALRHKLPRLKKIGILAATKGLKRTLGIIIPE